MSKSSEYSESANAMKAWEANAMMIFEDVSPRALEAERRY